MAKTLKTRAIFNNVISYNWIKKGKIRVILVYDLLGLARNLKFVLVIMCLSGEFGINLPSSLFEILKSPEWNEEDFKIPKNEGGKFSPNFTNKHVIPGQSHVTSSQRAHKGKNYSKKQSININKFNKHNSITPTLQ